MIRKEDTSAEKERMEHRRKKHSRLAYKIRKEGTSAEKEI